MRVPRAPLPGSTLECTGVAARDQGARLSAPVWRAPARSYYDYCRCGGGDQIVERAALGAAELRVHAGHSAKLPIRSLEDGGLQYCVDISRASCCGQVWS